MSATKGKALITGALLSSNSGFQRLSQAARFLRLAAGALLPFVGLRLSAANTPCAGLPSLPLRSSANRYGTTSSVVGVANNLSTTSAF